MSKNFTRIPDAVIYTCCGSKCKKKGGKLLYRSLKEQIKEAGAKGRIQVIKTGCTDRCKMGPVVAVMPSNNWYLNVSEEKAAEILSAVLRE